MNVLGGYTYGAERARQRLCLCAFVLWTHGSFLPSLPGLRLERKSSLNVWYVTSRRTRCYEPPRQFLKMEKHNPVLEALANPQFEAVKVGGAVYREINVPDSVRTYTDAPQWDQKQINAATRDSTREIMGYSRDSEANAYLFTDSQETEESLAGEEGSGRISVHQEGEPGVVGLPTRQEQGTGAADDANIAEGGKKSQDSGGTSFCAEEPVFDGSKGKWFLILSMRTPLFKVVVGKKKHTILARIAKQYNVRATCRYDTPRFKIRLEAAKRAPLRQACEHLMELVKQKKETIPYTHFISLPLTDPRFQERYNSFKTQVRAAYSNLDEALFPVPDNLHVTVLMLRLTTDEEETRCKEILESIVRDIYDVVDTRSLVLHLKGLDIMNDDPSAASVVYTSQYTGNEKDRETYRRLRRLCAVVTEAFRKGGILSEEEMTRQELHALPGEDAKQKLHATLLNAKMRLVTPTGRQPSKRATADSSQSCGPCVSASHNTFDATELLTNFKLFDFFECRVPSVELVARARYSYQGNAVTVASVRLP